MRFELIVAFSASYAPFISALLYPTRPRFSAISFQFGRASAPRWPQRSQRSRGPNDGTGTSSP